MKKRIIAALVLVTLIIGLCGTMASATGSATGTEKYQVGYAKVDINPYYSQVYETAMVEGFRSMLKTDSYTPTDDEVWEYINENLDGHAKGLAYGQIMPVPLQGNSHEEDRLAIGKPDDNGDGLINENDGIFATCIAITDPYGETVILMSTDLLGISAACAAAVRQGIHAEHPDITGDRVMINGSHSHHGVSINALSALKSSADVDDRAAYWMHKEWLNQLNLLLIQAAEEALADQKPATMSKGSIDSLQAECRTTAIGDTLNKIRMYNKQQDANQDANKYASVGYVTELENAATVSSEYDEDGIRHVAAQDVFSDRTYNAVRHYQQTECDVLRVPLWDDEGLFRAFDYIQYGDTGYTLTEEAAAAGYKLKDYVPGSTSDPVVFVGGDNFNGVSEVGGGSSKGSYWITQKDENSVVVTEDMIVANDQVEMDAKGWDVLTGTKKPYKTGTSTRVYKFEDMRMSSETKHVSEADDTLLITKFEFGDVDGNGAVDNDELPILLVNWRSHTNNSRYVSVDYYKEFKEIGFYESFFQVSGDWINAFRYALEHEGFRVAYFNGAAGNISTSSRLTAEGAWASWSEGTQAATLYTQADVTNGTIDPITKAAVTADMIGLCKEARAGQSVLEGIVLTDDTHARNRGNIYGTELAEVALECLDKYMTPIDTSNSSIRTRQIQYQTNKREIYPEEYLAAGQYRYWDYTEDNHIFDQAISKTYTVSYWLDLNGKPILDHASRNSGWSIYDENGNPNQMRDGNSQPVYDENGAAVLYTDADVTANGCTPLTDDQKNNKEQYFVTKTFTIASYLHAANAVKGYGTTSAGTQVELNAIMICDQLAIITAPGELYDRYSKNAAWSANGVSGMDDNLWTTLWSDSYGEPFFLGYCNGYTGYMPSQVTYEYSKGVNGKTQGSYETQITDFAQGTGEDVMVEFDWLLGGVNTPVDESALVRCEHCDKAVSWQPISEWQKHSAGFSTGHYYLDKDTTLEASIGAGHVVCLDLRGKTLTGTERAFNVNSGATLNIQDSGNPETGEKTGTVVGSGFASSGSYGGVASIANGATLNLYSGTLTYNKTQAYDPGNGGIVYVAGTFNMHGGAIQDGICSNAGGNIYVNYDGRLNMYGGSVTGGTCNHSDETIKYHAYSVMTRGYVLLSGEGSINNLLLWERGGPTVKEMLTVQGAYAGTTQLDFHSSVGTLTEGKDIGNSDGAVLTGTNLTVAGGSYLPTVLGTNIVLGNTDQRYCEHCKRLTSWVKLTADTAVTTGHYYISEATAIDTLTLSSGTEMCLDLRNNTLTGSERAFTVQNGAILSIQDSSEEKNGAVVGQGYETTAGYGGVAQVAAGGTLNLYSGTLRLELQDGYLKPNNGGVVYTNGVFNMHGGSITGGQCSNAGGAVYGNSESEINLYGGDIANGTSGEAVSSISCVMAKKSVTLAGDATMARLTLWPAAVADYANILTIQGKYTGSAELHFYKEPETIMVDGADIGTSDGAVLTEATLTVYNSDLLVQAVDTNIFLSERKAAQVMQILGGAVQAGYKDIQSAVDNCSKGQKVLLMDHVGELTVSSNDVTLDLNGKNVEKITVADGVKLACLDSANATYQDGTCGTVEQVVLGEGSQIVGAEATKIKEATETTKAVNSDVYMKVEESENTKVSFHAVGLNISAMNLNSATVGLYFVCDFKGDTTVQQKVDSYGVALNVQESPNADNLGDTSQYTRFYNKEGSEFGSDKAVTSTTLKNVMKTGQGNLTNRRNAKMPVYGRAYVQLKDGSYLFGILRERSLQEQVQKIDLQFDSLTDPQKAGVLDLYNRFSKAMAKWEIPKLKLAAEQQ